MSETTDDPYELHARRFLDRLRQLSRDFHDGEVVADGLVRKLAKCWPQILAAFWWASRAQSESAAAHEICEALMACADGDIAQLQFRRSSGDVRTWGEAAANYARQLWDNPNDAAFLYRFAGIAKVQSGILEIAEETRLQVHDLLGHLFTAVPKPDNKQQNKSNTGMK